MSMLDDVISTGEHDLHRYKRRVCGYASDSLYDRAVAHLDDGDLLRAKAVLDVLSHKEGNGSLPSILKPLFSSLMCLESSKANDYQSSEISARRSLYAMTETTDMYEKCDISLDDLLLTERVVDRVSERLLDLPLKRRDEYEEFYNRFKEYVLDAYCGES